MAESKDYWQARALDRLTTAEKKSEPYLKQIYGFYTNAQRQTVKDVQKIYNAYYKQNKWDTTKLNEIVPSGDLNRFREQMRAAGLETSLPERFNGRITRLEMLNAQLWGEAKKAGLQQARVQKTAHSQTVKDAYYRTIYDTAKSNGAIPAFSTLDKRTVDKILSTKFKGANYSTRIWKNTDKLADSLQEVIGKAVATGQAPEATARELRERFNVSRYNALRLVRTETAYFENAAELESYKEMGINRFQFLATLDSRTSEICREHDHTIYWVSRGVIGDNVPPLHPWCRSTIMPYVGKEYQALERIARDPATNENYYVAGNLNYAGWERLLVRDFADRIGRQVKITSVASGVVSTDFGAAFDAKSLKSVDVTLMKDVVGSAERVLTDFPAVQQWVKDEGGLYIYATEQLPQRAIAATVVKKAIIKLNPKYYAKWQKLSQTVFQNIKKGHFAPATNYKSYTFYHEMGHLVENYLLKGKSYYSGADTIRNEIIRIAMRQGKMSYNRVMAQVSKYGATNSREFFAEAFANLYSGRPNVLGKAMKTYLEKELK